MFLARCDYVSKLMDPRLFDHAMVEIHGLRDDSCLGTGRFASEHWIHSHPTVRPCDMYTETDFVWGMPRFPELNIEREKTHMDLQPAPRFHNLSSYILKYCRGIGVSRKARLDEYQRLYNETPAEDWWGWDLLSPDS
jgi:hypothetical protein